MLALFTMTCFWDSILTSLNKDDFKILGHETKLNRVDFIQDLKNKNTLISTKWCGKELKEQEKREHFEAIKCYNIKGIGRGHLTSICDSFLLLIAHLYKVNINHQYLSTNVSYTIDDARKTLSFKSNKGHFQICK